jgi:hypothetical protein
MQYVALGQRTTRAAAPPPASLERKAADDLRFIRSAMERSATFTAVPGRGGALMGTLGLAGCAIAAAQSAPERWLAVWLGTAAVAFTIGVWTMRRKALDAGIPVTGASAQRFALSLAAPLAAGAALTAALWAYGVWDLMPSVWLLLYGTGVLTGGMLSVAPLRLLGVCFMALGIIALLTPPSWGNAWLGLGFGVLQIGFGLYVAKNHGG